MLLLAQVQSLITGARTAELSDFEIIELAKLTPSVGVISVLAQGLEKRVIPAEKILPYLVLSADSADKELPIAMALRAPGPNGDRPNPNVYVRPIVGGAQASYQVHALLYLAQKLGATKLGGQLIELFLAAGARPTVAAYQGLPEGKPSPTVRQVAASKQIQLPAYVRETARRGLKPARAKTLAIALADESLMPSEFVAADREYQSLAIRTWSTLLPKVPRDLRYIGENEAGLDHSVKALNDRAYVYYLDQGLIPSYTLLNSIMTMAGAYRDWPLIRRDLQNMIIESVKRGSHLDLEQFGLYQRVGLDVGPLQAEYTKPYLGKVCSVTKGLAPRELRTLSEALGLSTGSADTSRASACSRLAKAAALPEAQLISAAYQRNEQLFQARSLHIDEIAANSSARVQCTPATTAVDIKTKAPRDVVYYRDDANKIWCFGRSSFGQLMKEKVNPNTSQKLPSFLLSEIEAKSKLWSRDQPIDEVISTMKNPEKIDNDDSEHVYMLFREFIISHKGRDVAGLQPDDVQKVYTTTGYPSVVSSLSPKHALYSLAHTAEFMFLRDKNSFGKIMLMLSASG